MIEVPNGWVRVRLGEISGQPQQRKPAPSDLFRYIDIASIDRQKKLISNAELVSGNKAPTRARKVVKSGDVLVSMTRPNLNAIALVSKEFNGQIASTGFDVLRPLLVEPSWIYYLVRTPKFIDAMSTSVQGALYPAVRAKDIRNFEVPLAPLAEQKRIVKKLNALVGKISASRDRLERVPRILNRFREAVLEAAASGQLTGVKESWKTLPFGDLIQNIRTGTTAVPTNTPSRYRVLRSSSVRPLEVDIADFRYVTEDQSVKEQNFLAVDDILFTRLSGSIEYVGNCARVHSLPAEGMQYPDRLFRARLKDPALARYIEIAFGSSAVRKQIEARVKSSAGHQRISTDAITRAIIPVPPPSILPQLYARVDSLLNSVSQLRTRTSAISKMCDQLTPAMLSRAFCGELVPHDPTDEPASVLLERIRSGREAETNLKRPKRRPDGKQEKV
ncbi:MAG TPA: restriction endonuclease subunit S [Chthoniobacterales bacterium]|nr:restriction endonuclease subunit S [Chthoniobacterales bacterium]